VQAAERERAVAEARAVEERRRRKLQLGLAAAVLAFTTLGGLSTTYYLQQRQARAAAIDRIVGQALTLRAQALTHADDVARWQVALAAVDQADAGGDGQAEARLVALRTEIQSGLDAARRDRGLLDRLVDIRSAEADDPDGSMTDAGYADAFREAGIELAALPPAEAGAKIRARPPSVALALAAALDDWAKIRRNRRTDAAGAAALSAAARAADPDPWRNELRTALDRSDKTDRLTALQGLARSAKFDELGPVSLHLLGAGLNDAGDSALAESVLRSAQERHPGDVWVNYALGFVLEKLSRRDEAIRFYTAARAIRPEMSHELAHALEARGQSDEAIAVFRDLRRLRPGNAKHLTCLGKALKHRGLSREANEALEAAVAAGREQIRLKPEDASAHMNLGGALNAQGKQEEAIAEYREAIRLKPDDVYAHNNLGAALRNQGRLDEAIAEYREAIRLKPDDVYAHNNLGYALGNQGKPEEAIAEYREAIRLKPDFAAAHYGLGNLLLNKRKWDETIAEFRTAIRLQPDFAEAHCNLGQVLREQGDFSGSLESYRRGHELGSRKPDWQYPSGAWVADAERMLALSPRFPALLRGEDTPRDNAERIAFARMCYATERYAAATRLWAETLETDPKLVDDRAAHYRDGAACAAAMAGCRQGKDDPKPDEGARAKMRSRALAWLKAELTALGRSLDGGDARVRADVAQTLRHWRIETDLAGVRDSDALAKLPEAERAAWRALWADVKALLKRAESRTP
jgi:tetratricopeptide (TPR) repeat protein